MEKARGVMPVDSCGKRSSEVDYHIADKVAGGRDAEIGEIPSVGFLEIKGKTGFR